MMQGRFLIWYDFLRSSLYYAIISVNFGLISDCRTPKNLIYIINMDYEINIYNMT